MLPQQFLFILALYLSSCTHSARPANSSDPSSDTSAAAEQKRLAQEMQQKQIDYFIINVPDNQFGYYIMVDGQMYIEQKHIPAIEGHYGFRTKEDAEKIAKLAIEKIKMGEMPPTITTKELIANGISIEQ